MAFFTVFRRELTLSWRARSDVYQPLIYFGLVCTLAPMGVNPGPALLQTMAPAILWLGVLLAVLMSLDKLFRDDHDDGVIEQMLVAAVPLWIVVLAKLSAHWLLVGGLFSLAVLPAALMFGLQADVAIVAVVSVALGTISLTALGGIGAALTVGHGRGGMLVAVLVLPLFVPVLIFGAGSIHAVSQGLPVAGSLYLLAAQAVFHATFAPLAIAAALRISHS